MGIKGRDYIQRKGGRAGDAASGEPRGTRLSNNNISNNTNFIVWIFFFFWSCQRKESEKCVQQSAERSLAGLLPSTQSPENQQNPEASERKGTASTAGGTPATGGPGVESGWPCRQGGRKGAGKSPVKTPCNERKEEIAICPWFAVAFQQRHSEARGGAALGCRSRDAIGQSSTVT